MTAVNECGSALTSTRTLLLNRDDVHEVRTTLRADAHHALRGRAEPQFGTPAQGLSLSPIRLNRLVGLNAIAEGFRTRRQSAHRAC